MIDSMRLMELRHAMEKSRADLRYVVNVTRQAYLCLALAFTTLFGSLIAGPLEFIPESMAWGIGIFGTIVFGAISGIQFDWVGKVSITDRRHEFEIAEKRYYDALSQ